MRSGAPLQIRRQPLFSPAATAGLVRIRVVSAMYLEGAEDFYQAFRGLPPRHPPQSWPRYFMLCHAVELALKSYLALHGATPQQLRESGLRNNLTELLTRSVSAGLSLTASAQSDIKLLQEAHEKFWHRYPKGDGAPVFIIEQFEPATRELPNRVSVALRGGASMVTDS
jgi:hypothetical protein